MYDDDDNNHLYYTLCFKKKFTPVTFMITM